MPADRFTDRSEAANAARARWREAKQIGDLRPAFEGPEPAKVQAVL
jgi:hypothetical protein